MLVKFIDEKKERWQDVLDTCVYAYNTSKHESTKFSPFEIMFGRIGVLPADFININKQCEDELLPDDDSAETNDETIDGMEKDRRSKLEVAKDNIIVAQKRQKEQYDRKHHAPEVNFNHNN